MKRVATAVILIPLVVVALFKAPLWLFALLVFGVAVLAAHEYLGIAKAQGFQPMQFLGYLSLALTFTSFYMVARSVSDQMGSVGMMALLLFWSVPSLALPLPLIFLLASMRRGSLAQSLPDATVSYMLLPYIGFTLALLPVLRSTPNGALYVLFLMLLVWCGDIAAYYVGRAVGRHKLAPRISPGKTWEGAVASVLGAVVMGLLLFRFINPIANALRAMHLLDALGDTYVRRFPDASTTLPLAPLWFVALFAVGVNVVSQLGDLWESTLKRGAGVKDSGTLLPGHGGVLDRIDALLFALPVGYIFHLFGMAKYFKPPIP